MWIIEAYSPKSGWKAVAFGQGTSSSESDFLAAIVQFPGATLRQYWVIDFTSMRAHSQDKPYRPGASEQAQAAPAVKTATSDAAAKTDKNAADRYLVQALINGRWASYLSKTPAAMDVAMESFAILVKNGVNRAFRVVDALTGAVLCTNAAAMERACAEAGAQTPKVPAAQETKPFHIVMSLDKPGPRERNGGEYHRHTSRDDAVREARRLSAACRGGRFAVLSTSFVTGWVEHDLKASAADDGIPF